jgi:hypothetical protein
MAEFNIQQSKIEQLNNSGTNYKVTGASGNVAFTGEGGTLQSAGTSNTVKATRASGFWSALWGKIRACVVWLFG